MLASWFRILWGDGLPAQALIMDTRLPNIEHGGAGGRTPKRLALFLCFPNFASHVRTHQMTSFLSGFTKYGAWGVLVRSCTCSFFVFSIRLSPKSMKQRCTSTAFAPVAQDGLRVLLMWPGPRSGRPVAAQWPPSGRPSGRPVAAHK